MLYDVMSIVLGLLAWGIGIAGIFRKRNRWCVFSSFTLCGGALVCQFYGFARLTKIGDWSSIEDTIHVAAACAVILLVVTVGLNLAATLRGNRRAD